MADRGQNLLALPPLPKVRDKKGKKKIEIKQMENDSRRSETLRKRRNSIIKKARELHEAVDVDVSVIIYSPEEDTPLVYPNVEVAQAACREFMQLPVHDRVVHMRTHQQFLQDTLDKKLQRIENKQEEIEEKETTIQLYKALEGGDIAGLDLERKMKMKSMMQKMYLELFPKSSLALPSAQQAASDLMPLPEQLDSLMPLPEQLDSLMPLPEQLEPLMPLPEQLDSLMPLPEQLEPLMPLPEQLEPTGQNSGFADGNPGFHLDDNW